VSNLFVRVHDEVRTAMPCPPRRAAVALRRPMPSSMLSDLLSLQGKTSHLPKLGAGPWSQPLCHGLVGLPVAAEEKLERAQVLQRGEGRPQHHTRLGGQLLRPSTHKGKTPTSASPTLHTGARRLHRIGNRRVGPEAACCCYLCRLMCRAVSVGATARKAGARRSRTSLTNTTTVPISDLLQSSVSAPRTDIGYM
jgi:hypothetical protein